MTSDFGMSWVRLQELVKVFFWIDSGDGQQTLLFQRQEPMSSSILALSNLSESERSNKITVLITDVVDFWVKGDFMFVTKRVAKVIYLY